MAVPKAIEQQVAAAEKLQQELYSPQATPVEATPPETAKVEPPAEPPKATAEIVELHAKPAEPTVVEPPKPAPSDDAALWKQRFDSLQGKYNKEVPILHRQLKEQTQQLTALQAKVEELHKAPAAPEPAAQSVKDSDVESFGADLIEFVQRMSRSTANEVVKGAVAEVYKNLGAVREQVSAVEETTVQSKADRFWEKVSELVPDWATVDQDPSWVDFLNSAPEFSERTYRELAQDAIRSGSAAKVANLVKTWRGEPAAPTPTPPVPNPELQRQVAPSTSRASTPTPVGEKIWSKAEYEAAYDVRNVQRFGEKKAKEMIAEADRAVAEGRVRWF